MPDFYKALAPLAADELATLRQSDDAALARLVIDGITVEDGAQIVVTFRDAERPGCLFGWRWSWRRGRFRTSSSSPRRCCV
ncbi:MAG TPA: hypothetical protein VF066_00045 [Thermoleophilaceae bacterium]